MHSSHIFTSVKLINDLWNDQFITSLSVWCHARGCHARLANERQTCVWNELPLLDVKFIALTVTLMCRQEPQLFVIGLSVWGQKLWMQYSSWCWRLLACWVLPFKFSLDIIWITYNDFSPLFNDCKFLGNIFIIMAIFSASDSILSIA